MEIIAFILYYYTGCALRERLVCQLTPQSFSQQHGRHHCADEVRTVHLIYSNTVIRQVNKFWEY